MNLFRISLTLFISMMVCFSATNLAAATNQPAKASQPVLDSKTIPPNEALYEFTYTLDFARKLGFSKVVNLIEQEDYAKALIALDKKTAINFKWNQDATNCYKDGFFSEALKGICLEKSGEVVKAYRTYQNARHYCNEKNVRMADVPLPAPDLEIYIGIGRMCNEANRYNDALAYLESARLQAAEYPSVAIVADRALIKRFEIVGDFKEVIELFKDLNSFIKLEKEEYINYANMFFKINQNKSGFKILIDGALELGIDYNSRLEDPIILCFKMNLVNADEYSINYFYELLGVSFENLNIYKCNAKNIASIIIFRKQLCKLFSFLQKENDIAKLKQRIEPKNVKAKVKTKVSQNHYYQKSKTKKMARIPLNKKDDILSMSLLENIEDTMMMADLSIFDFNYKNKLSLYSEAFNIIVSNNINGLYDGLSYKDNALLGIARCTKNINDLVLYNGSIKACNIAVLIWGSMTNSSAKSSVEEYIQNNIQFASDHIRQFYYSEKLDKFVESGDIENAEALYDDIIVFAPNNSQFHLTMSMVYAAKGETQKAFNVLMRGIKSTYYKIYQLRCLRKACETWSWASDDDLKDFSQLYPVSALANAHQSLMFGKALDWRDIFYEKEKQLRSYMENHQYNKALNSMSERSCQPQHYLYRAIAHENLNEYALATNAVLTSYNKTKNITEKTLGINVMPSEKEYLNNFFDNTTK